MFSGCFHRERIQATAGRLEIISANLEITFADHKSNNNERNMF